MAELLVNQTVMTILLIIGISGIVIELIIPGYFVSGIVGVLAFSLYFYAHYTAGNAEVLHIVLFVIGIILILIEAVMPSIGVLGIGGVVSVISGVVLAANNTEDAFLALGIAVLISIVIIFLTGWYFKHKGIWNKFVLQEQTSTESGYVSQTSKQHLVGKEGVAMSPLRPAGIALIDEQRIDVVSGGDFIGVNEHIVVIQVEGTRVVVRKK